MKNTYRGLLSVGITLSMSMTSLASVVVDTNIVGNSSTTNSMAKTVTPSTIMPTVTDTNMLSDLSRYLTESSLEEVAEQEGNGDFFHVRWMDVLMNSVDFDSTVTEGGGTFGIDTAMMRIVRIRKDMYFGPFYVSKYPLSSVGPQRDVTDIGIMLRFDLQ